MKTTRNLVKIKLLKEDVTLPEYKTMGAAGMDVHSPEQIRIYPGQVVHIPCGFAIEVPSGYEMQVRPRSGLSKLGVLVANAPGTIDEDYRGEVGVLLYNANPMTYEVQKGERIAQLVLQEVPKFGWAVVDNLGDTERGSGGFGSTGK